MLNAQSVLSDSGDLVAKPYGHLLRFHSPWNASIASPNWYSVGRTFWTAPMDAITRGSCLRGAVTYQVTAQLKAATHRHCKKCQKGHGVAFATYASALRSEVTIQAVRDALKSNESSPDITRQFCSECGSPPFWSDAKGKYPKWISIALGTLDTPFKAQNQAHSCIESKAIWPHGQFL